MTDLPDKRPETPKPPRSPGSPDSPDSIGEDDLGAFAQYTDEPDASLEPEQRNTPDGLDDSNDDASGMSSEDPLDESDPRNDGDDGNDTNGATSDEAIASDEALHDAIDALESMLADHGVGDSRGGRSSLPAPDPSGPNEEPDGQFTIPLLNEVVVSGAEANGLPEPIRAILPDMVDAGDMSHTGSASTPYDGGDDQDDRYIGDDDIELNEDDYEAHLYSHLIARLKSEIEVIVQGEIESIVKDAAKRVTKKVDTHVQIVLPEILDEIALILSERNRKR
jgi:hypothetical protein